MPATGTAERLQNLGQHGILTCPCFVDALEKMTSRTNGMGPGALRAVTIGGDQTDLLAFLPALGEGQKTKRWIEFIRTSTTPAGAVSSA